MNTKNKVLICFVLLCLALLVFSVQISFLNDSHDSENNDKVIVMPRYPNQSGSISFEEAKKLNLIYKNEN